MVKRTFTPEQIISKLREAEILISQGATSTIGNRVLTPAPIIHSTKMLIANLPASGSRVTTISTALSTG